jgi:hypothetical protein
MLNIQIYGNANAISRTITVDFFADVTAYTSFQPSNAASSCIDYYIKFTPSAPDTNGVTLPIKIVTGLDATNTASLVLNGVAQKGSNACSDASCSTNAYTNITELVVDYVYDYIIGHGANACSSGCTAQLPMQF